jgi:hypothetical protein
MYGLGLLQPALKQAGALHAPLLLAAGLVLVAQLAGCPAPLASLLAASASEALDPFPGVMFALVMALGLPAGLLADTSPLMQPAASLANPAQSPYRLYALSNAELLLRLGANLLVLEPLGSLRAHAIA